VFGVILLLLVFSSLPTQTTSSAYDDADAYEVYAAILPSEWPLRVAHAKQLVIRRETKSYQMCAFSSLAIEAIMSVIMLREVNIGFFIVYSFAKDLHLTLMRFSGSPTQLRIKAVHGESAASACWACGQWDNFMTPMSTMIPSIRTASTYHHSFLGREKCPRHTACHSCDPCKQLLWSCPH
jgi:hypothetical protein